MERAEAKALGLMTYVSAKPCRNGHTTPKHVREGCLECKKAKRLRHKIKHPEKTWAEDIIRQARYRAAKANPPIPHTVDAAYVKSILTDKCPIFGTPFVFRGNKKMVPESPSLDRLDPKLGYVPGNITVISVKANLIKSAYGSEEILKVGEWLKSRGL